MGLLDNWFCANKLSLNLSKTVLMQYWLGRKRIKVSIAGFEIPSVECILDNTLSWSQHVLALTSKLHANMHLLFMCKNLLPHGCLRSIYFSHFHSHISYGLLTWGSSISEHNLNNILKVQRNCIRLMVGKVGQESVDNEFNLLKILKITDMIKIKFSKFGLKIMKNAQPQPLQQMMDAQIPYSSK